MRKVLIFDFDGTIVNSKDLIIQIYNELAEKYHYKKIKQEEVLKLSHVSIIERCKLLNVPICRIPILVFEARRNYKNYICNLELIDGVSLVLHKLKEDGFKLAIISSNSKTNIKSFLVKNDIDIFQSICSSKNIFGKHFTINAFLKKFKFKKESVLYIGDEIRDIISCKRCNIKVVAVTWGYDSGKLLQEEKPDFIINEPTGLIDIVNNN